MYLAPYILLGLAVAASLVFAVRAMNSTDGYKSNGIIIRAVLTLMLLAFIGALWYYTDEKYIKNATVETWIRIISAACFTLALPDIWLDKKKEE